MGVNPLSRRRHRYTLLPAYCLGVPSLWPSVLRRHHRLLAVIAAGAAQELMPETRVCCRAVEAREGTVVIRIIT